MQKEKTSLPILELRDVFASDAANLIQARDRARTIHGTRDISSAGDEVEQPARDFFHQKLGLSYHIGHGHVIDSKLVTSPQIDQIIATNNHTPVLLRTSNGTEYIPYESVYAIGEVKSTYQKSKNYFESFSGVLRRINTQLKRERTPKNYLGNGVHLGDNFGISGRGSERPYKNPLFSFMLFVDKGDFKWQDVASHFATTPVEELPNVVCILNECIIANANVNDKGCFLGYNCIPEFNGSDSMESTARWILTKHGNEADRPAYTLAGLFLLLQVHLSGCDLMPPDMQKYINNIFSNVPAVGSLAISKSVLKS